MSDSFDEIQATETFYRSNEKQKLINYNKCLH